MSKKIAKTTTKFVSFNLFKEIPKSFCEDIEYINTILLDKQCSHLENAIKLCTNKDFLDNAVKFVFEYGDEATKQSFLDQFDKLDESKKDRFYYTLNSENQLKLKDEFPKKIKKIRLDKERSSSRSQETDYSGLSRQSIQSLEFLRMLNKALHERRESDNQSRKPSGSGVEVSSHIQVDNIKREPNPS